jgi:TonB family protein
MDNKYENQDKALTYLLIVISFILHVTFIIVIIFAPPAKKDRIEKKLFNLVELQHGVQQVTEQIQKQVLQKPSEQVSKSKSLKSQSSVEPQTGAEPIQQTSSNPEILTTSGQTTDNTPVIAQGVPHGGIKSDTSASIVASSETVSQPGNHQSEVETIDAGVTGLKPVKIYGPEPAYPLITQDLGITGTVKAILTIDEKGNVTEISIESSPHKSMSDEVKRTLAKWKFKPVQYKGSQVIVKRFIQEIEYRSED